MNGDNNGEWQGSGKRGRNPVPDHLRLDSPLRIRFSDDDLDTIAKAMRVEEFETGDRLRLGSWIRQTVVREARRTVLRSSKKRRT